MDELDPMQKLELALLRAEHQKQFQLMINYVKEQVGEGIEYKNQVVRVVVSDKGAYYELKDLPEEFCGGVGAEIEQHFISPETAIARLTNAVQAIKRIRPENTRHFSLMVLYTRRGIVDRQNCYVYDYHAARAVNGAPPIEIGKFQPGIMPLFFKIKMDADSSEDIMGLSRGGVLFCMKNEGDRHLLVAIPYDTEHLVNLIDMPAGSTIN